MVKFLRYHVLPVGDLDIHQAQTTCWCHPLETEPNLWVHNAKDCREARERITGKKVSDGWINIAEAFSAEGAEPIEKGK